MMENKKMNQAKEDLRRSKYFTTVIKNEKLILLAMFLIACIIKILIVIPGDAPMMFGDEFLYKENAKYITELDYFNKHYPPFYPFVLSLSFIINSNNFYIIIQVINVIITSMLIFPTWLLSRKYLDNKGSIIIALIVSIIPFQFVYPRLIMSENLYYALFIFLMYITIKSSEKFKYIDSVVLGVTISLCLMTRYMTYALLPFIVLIWCVLSYFNLKDKEIRIKNIIVELLSKGIAIVASTITVAIPWVLVRYFKGYPILEIFNEKSSTYLTSEFDNFPKWILFYLSYFILTMGPLILPIIYGVIDYRRSINNKRLKQYIFAVISITIPIIFLAIRHSAKSYYNQEIPNYIIGRYVMYLFPLWLVLSFLLTSKIYTHKDYFITKQDKIKIVISGLISSVLIYLSYFTIIEGKFFDITNWFVMVHNAVDAYAFKGMGNKFLIFTLVLVVILSLLMIKKCVKSFKYVLISFFIVSSLISFNAIYKSQANKLFNNNIVNHIKDNYKKVYVSKDLVSQQYYYIKFWEIEDIMIEYDEEIEIDSEIKDGDIILSSKKLPLETVYNYNDSYLYKYSQLEINIEATYPSKITIGKKFNVQKSGNSAMSIKGSGFISGCYVTINGEKVNTTFGSSESISIIVDEKYYTTKDDLIIQVVYSNIKSNEIIIPVR
ncbi:MAG TPA: hypothetical protein GX708_24790 [Gallicola sp.]|nr:hypothetical protein [Gallicola sp.]